MSEDLAAFTELLGRIEANAAVIGRFRERVRWL
jgi:hypothetical protein